MSETSVLLIEPNRAHTAQIRQELSRLIDVTLIEHSSGEEALVWAQANRCAVCIIEQTLPGISGLETLARLRQRHPDLPAIMLAATATAQGAIAAFHAGILDYVPKQRGYATAIHDMVKQVVNRVPTDQLIRPPLIPSDLPDELVRPTYQNRLRVIGHQLDQHEYRGINVLEVGGGFLVRALAPKQRMPEALEFPNRDFPQLAASIGNRDHFRSRRSGNRLVPTGYEDLLRALGEWLDRRLAEAIAIAELDTVIAISGVGKIEAAHATNIGPFHRLLQVSEIELLIEQTERRRLVQTPGGSGLMRRLQQPLA